MSEVYRRLIRQALRELQMIEEHIEQLDREAMSLLKDHRDAVRRVAEAPGFGVDSALQMIEEVGPQAAAFSSAKQLCSWVGACPGNQGSSKAHGRRKATVTCDDF